MTPLDTLDKLILGSLMAALVLLVAAAAGAVVYWLACWQVPGKPRVKSVNVLLAGSAMPLGVVLLLAGLTLMPSFANWLGIISDHCHQAMNGSRELCSPHRPVPLHDVLQWWMYCLLGGVLLLFLFVLSKDVEKITDLLRTFLTFTRRCIAGDVGVVHWNGPLAVTVGFPRACIFISSHLIDHLSEKELAVVLAHERAHVCGHDTVKSLVARTFSMLQFPGIRRRLLRDLSLAMEHACDESASTKVGGRLHVAETILSVEHLYSAFPRQAEAMSIAGSNIRFRVETLLSHQGRAVLPWLFPALGSMAVCLSILVIADPLHQFIEAVLGGR